MHSNNEAYALNTGDSLTSYIDHNFRIIAKKWCEPWIKRLSGLSGRLLGFEKKVVVYYENDLLDETLSHIRSEGVYEIIGDAVLVMDTGGLIKVPIGNITYDDIGSLHPSHPVNLWLHQARLYHRLIGTVKPLTYNLHDTVLVCLGQDQEIIGEVIDVCNQNGVVYYYVLYGNDDCVCVTENDIIQTVRCSEITEWRNELSRRMKLEELIRPV